MARDLLTVCGNGGGYPGVNWSGGGTIYGLRLAWGGDCGGCGREVGSKAPHLKQSRLVGVCWVPHLGQKFVIRITRKTCELSARRKEKDHFMNKAELVELIAQDAEISKAAAEKALNAILSGIADGLRNGKDVTLPTLGSFKLITYKPRRTINPQTKRPMQLPERKSVRFAVNTRLKNALNR